MSGKRARGRAERTATPADAQADFRHRARGDCAACGARRTGPYCARCGEKAPSPRDHELGSILHEAAHEFFHLDGKLVRSLVALVSKPGLLAREYFDGRRGRYARPLALFVFVNLVFFFVQPHTGLLRYGFDEFVGRRNDGRIATLQRSLVERRLAETGETREVYRARFDALLQGRKKSFLVFVVPIFALGLKVLYPRRGYVEHLVFAVHLYAVYLLALLAIVFVGMRLVIWPLASLAIRNGLAPPGLARALDSEGALVVLLLATLGTHLFLGLRRFYADRPAPALARTLVLFAWHALLMAAFRVGLFFATCAAT